MNLSGSNFDDDSLKLFRPSENGKLVRISTVHNLSLAKILKSDWYISKAHIGYNPRVTKKSLDKKKNLYIQDTLFLF